MSIKPKLPGWTIKYLGPESAPNRIWAQAITHGVEQAPLLSLKWAAEELKPQNTRVALVAADPQGFTEEGYGFITLDGTEMVDDPWYRGDPFGDPYLRRAFDENSAWGMSAPLTERHKQLREALHEFSPTFVLSLHETVGSGRTPFFWGGAGILLLETYPTSPTDWDLLPGAVTGTEGIRAILNPLQYLTEMLVDWGKGVLGRPIYKRLEKSMRDNPHHRLITRIVDRYKALGGSLCGKPWMNFLDGWYKNSMVGEGRINRSLWTGITDWLTLSSYAVANFGCPAITTESFDPIRAGTWGISERAEQQFLMIRAVMEELDGLD